MKRSIAEDTVDEGGGRVEGESRSPCTGASVTAGGTVDFGEAARGTRGAGIVVAGACAGAWAAHGAGSTRATSRARARIGGQAVHFFITKPLRSGVPRYD